MLHKVWKTKILDGPRPQITSTTRNSFSHDQDKSNRTSGAGTTWPSTPLSNQKAFFMKKNLTEMANPHLVHSSFSLNQINVLTTYF